MNDAQGPWGARDGSGAPPTVAVSEHRLGPVSVRIEKTEPAPGQAAPLDQGQHPAWAIASTAALAGYIWWMSGSWLVAVAAIYGLLVHEYGHVLAMNRLGMGPARIYIVPFLGGVARSQRLPQSEWHGVLVSLAGPLFGILATLPFFAGWMLTGGTSWLLGAFAIAMINLVNLAPAPPLDGSKALGPVLAKIHPLLEKAALVLIGVVVVAWGVANGSYIFAAFLAVAMIGRLMRGPWRPEGRPLTNAEALQSVGLFAVVVLICAATAMAALIPMAGSVEAGLDMARRYLEFGN